MPCLKASFTASAPCSSVKSCNPHNSTHEQHIQNDVCTVEMPLVSSGYCGQALIKKYASPDACKFCYKSVAVAATLIFGNAKGAGIRVPRKYHAGQETNLEKASKRRPSHAQYSHFQAGLAELSLRDCHIGRHGDALKVPAMCTETRSC